jgi:thiol-disulfide isomerase/thioredoxin
MSEAEKKRKRYVRLAIEIGLVIAVFFAIRAWQTRNVPDGPMPELSGPTLDGEAFALAARPGEPVLVHFWATWCGVCQAEEGTIDALADDHRVITIAAQSGDATDVREYMRRAGVDFPVVVDQSGALARRWGVSAFPTSFVISPDGEIESAEIGYTTSIGLRARMWLAR